MILQNHLPAGGFPENFQKYCRLLEKKNAYVIIDVGFGTGSTTLQAIKHLREHYGNPQITVYALENDTSLLNTLHERAHHLLSDEHSILESLARTRGYQDATLTIQVLEGDAQKTITEVPEQADYVFYDLFGPAGYEQLWDTNMFKLVRNKTKTGGKLGTHSISTTVRIALVRAGFEVRNGPGFWQGLPSTHATAVNY